MTHSRKFFLNLQSDVISLGISDNKNRHVLDSFDPNEPAASFNLKHLFNLAKALNSKVPKIEVNIPESLLKNETLIDNQKEVTSRLLEYCGLEWEDACLEFYKTERNIRTISLRQVRNPINKNSLGVWKKYSESFKRMNDILREFQ